MKVFLELPKKSKAALLLAALVVRVGINPLLYKILASVDFLYYRKNIEELTEIYVFLKLNV